MMHLGKTTATAALVMTALAAPTAVALQQHSTDTKASKAAAVKLEGDTWVRTELFFGFDKPGPDVTNYQFSKFVDTTVTPRFPDGLTVLDGNGQWKDHNGKLVKEHSKVIIILYPVAGADASSKKIDEIRSLYRKRFQQESVLRTDTTEQVDFDETDGN